LHFFGVLRPHKVTYMEATNIAAAALERLGARSGWVLSYVDANGVLTDLVHAASEHPVETLFGWTAPAGTIAVCVAGKATVSSAETSSTGRVARGSVTDMTGPFALAAVADGKVAVVGFAAHDGLLADVLRRCVGAPVPVSNDAIPELVARIWGHRLLSSEVFDREAITNTDPTPLILSARAAALDDPLGWLSETVSGPAADGDWMPAASAVQITKSTPTELVSCLDDGMSAAVSAWAGAELRLKLAVAQLPSPEAILVALAERNTAAAAAWAEVVIRRGWWSPHLETVPG